MDAGRAGDVKTLEHFIQQRIEGSTWCPVENNTTEWDFWKIAFSVGNNEEFSTTQGLQPGFVYYWYRTSRTFKENLWYRETRDANGTVVARELIYYKKE